MKGKCINQVNPRHAWPALHQPGIEQRTSWMKDHCSTERTRNAPFRGVPVLRKHLVVIRTDGLVELGLANLFVRWPIFQVHIQVATYSLPLCLYYDLRQCRYKCAATTKGRIQIREKGEMSVVLLPYRYCCPCLNSGGQKDEKSLLLPLEKGRQIGTNRL